MAGGAHLQSMLTPVPLWACCLFSCLSLDTFLFLFLSTTVKSASSFCTAGADCGLSALPPNTQANVGDEGLGGSGEEGGSMAPVESIGTSVCRGGNISIWVYNLKFKGIQIHLCKGKFIPPKMLIFYQPPMWTYWPSHVGNSSQRWNNRGATEGIAHIEKKSFIIYLREKRSKQNICNMRFWT